MGAFALAHLLYTVLCNEKNNDNKNLDINELYTYIYPHDHRA